MADINGVKTGGRVKGTLNKDNETKAFIKSLIINHQDKLLIEIDKLKGKPFVDAMLSFYDFVIPKLSRTEFKGDLDIRATANLTNYTKEDLKQISDIRKKNEEIND